MVKEVIIQKDLLLKEDERLEALFRQKISSMRNLQINENQVRNRIIDFLDIYVEENSDTKAGLASILTVYRQIINQLCLSRRFEYINGSRLFKILAQVINRCEAHMEHLLIEIGELLNTVFNIFVFRGQKQYINELISITKLILAFNGRKMDQLLGLQLQVFINYIQKGKEIDKIFFTFRKIVLKRPLSIKNHIEVLLNILESGQNTFFTEFFLKLLVKVSALSMRSESVPPLVDEMAPKIIESIDKLSEHIEKEKILKENKKQRVRITKLIDRLRKKLLKKGK